MILILGVTALCILLKRFAYPNQLEDMRRQFGLSISTLSRVTNATIRFICDNWFHLLNHLNNLQWNQNRVQLYAEVS